MSNQEMNGSCGVSVDEVVGTSLIYGNCFLIGIYLCITSNKFTHMNMIIYMHKFMHMNIFMLFYRELVWKRNIV